MTPRLRLAVSQNMAHTIFNLVAIIRCKGYCIYIYIFFFCACMRACVRVCVYHQTHNTQLSAKNLGFIFDSTLSFSKQISSLSSACHYHIRDLRRIRHTLDSTTATTIATALVHLRLDYCNSLYHGLPITQIKRLQHMQN